MSPTIQALICLIVIGVLCMWSVVCTVSHLLNKRDEEWMQWAKDHKVKAKEWPHLGYGRDKKG